MRKQIQEGEKLSVRMSEADRRLFVDHTLGDPEYAERLRPAESGRGLVGAYTLDDIEDMLGYIAAEANHTENPKLRKKLDALYDRLYKVQRAYDDGNWNDSSGYDSLPTKINLRDVQQPGPATGSS